MTFFYIIKSLSDVNYVPQRRWCSIKTAFLKATFISKIKEFKKKKASWILLNVGKYMEKSQKFAGTPILHRTVPGLVWKVRENEMVNV